MSWGILLFFLMYPWRLTVLNLPWEMAVTQDLSLYQGKQAFYRGKRAMCNRNYSSDGDSGRLRVLDLTSQRD